MSQLTAAALEKHGHKDEIQRAKLGLAVLLVVPSLVAVVILAVAA